MHTNRTFVWRCVAATVIAPLPHIILLSIIATARDLADQTGKSLLFWLAPHLGTVVTSETYVSNFLKWSLHTYPLFFVFGVAFYATVRKYHKFTLPTCLMAGLIPMLISELTRTGAIGAFQHFERMPVIILLLVVLTVIPGVLVGGIFWLIFVFRNPKLAGNPPAA